MKTRDIDLSSSSKGQENALTAKEYILSCRLSTTSKKLQYSSAILFFGTLENPWPPRKSHFSLIFLNYYLVIPFRDLDRFKVLISFLFYIGLY